MNTISYHLSSTSESQMLLIQITALLTIAWIAHFFLRKANPSWTTLLWRGVAVGVTGISLAGSFLPRLDWEIPVLKAQPVIAESVETPAPAAAGGDSSPWAFSLDGGVNVWHWSSTIMVLWLGGVAILLARLLVGWLRLLTLIGNSEIAPSQVQNMAAGLNNRPGKSVEVRFSREISSPFLYGFFRPVILLPQSMCEEEFRDDLWAVLAHEWIHARNRDTVWNLVLQLTGIVLWFHPLAWRIRQAHLDACDRACDSESARLLGDVNRYCQSLARVAIRKADPLPGFVPAMARPATIVRRLEFLRENGISRGLGRKEQVLFVAAVLSLIFFLSNVRPTLAESKPAATGRIIELVINDDQPEFGDFLVDFDKGTVSSPDAEFSGNSLEAVMKWVRAKGIDAMGEGDHLLGFDMVVLPTSNRSFDKVSKTKLRDLDKATAGNPVPIMPGRELPSTYVFKTRDGGKGVLQVLEILERTETKPQRTKIRYRVIQ